jgi:hypothetical protein
VAKLVSTELDTLGQQVQLVRVVGEMPGLRSVTMMTFTASVRIFGCFSHISESTFLF